MDGPKEEERGTLQYLQSEDRAAMGHFFGSFPHMEAPDSPFPTPDNSCLFPLLLLHKA